LASSSWPACLCSPQSWYSSTDGLNKA